MLNDEVESKNLYLEDSEVHGGISLASYLIISDSYVVRPVLFSIYLIV